MLNTCTSTVSLFSVHFFLLLFTFLGFTLDFCTVHLYYKPVFCTVHFVCKPVSSTLDCKLFFCTLVKIKNSLTQLNLTYPFLFVILLKFELKHWKHLKIVLETSFLNTCSSTVSLSQPLPLLFPLFATVIPTLCNP